MKKVLIAEDSSVIQNLTKKILEFQNFEIISVKNGHDVLEILKQAKVDLILMDINMPGLDGLQCSKIIRNSQEVSVKDIPIIAITGNAKNYTSDEFYNAGINDYIHKPLNFDLLVDKVKQWTM